MNNIQHHASNVEKSIDVDIPPNSRPEMNKSLDLEQKLPVKYNKINNNAISFVDVCFLQRQNIIFIITISHRYKWFTGLL